MRAAVMRRVDGPLSVEEVTHDEPGPGEVLVRVAATGICHSDLRFLEGSYTHPLPTILGHESAGAVVAVGDGVTAVSAGDHVVTTLSTSCGGCSQCAAGRPHLCISRQETRRPPGSRPRLSQRGAEIHQFLDLSSFAERVLVHESAVVAITGEIPLDVAALLGCGVATGLGAVLNTAGVDPGESVAVIGCGGVGLAAVQGARIAGAEPVIAVDRVPSKLALAAELGASDVVDASGADPMTAVLELTGGEGVDHAIEAIGSTATAEQAFAMTRAGGTATVVGLIPAGRSVSIPADLLFGERRIQGSVIGSNRPRVDIPRYIGMYLDGRLNLDDLVTRRLRLEEIDEGLAAMRSGEAVRSLVTFD